MLFAGTAVQAQSKSMSTEEVANKLVELCRKGAWMDAEPSLDERYALGHQASNEGDIAR